MSSFETRLNQARNGNGVLFCGAGFTADCLNFNPDVRIGTGSHLLSVFNEELQRRGKTHGYRDIRNAADDFNLREYHIAPLTDKEVDALIPLADQIAAWRHLQADMPVNKRQFVVKTCNSSLPSFLLRLLKSEHVRQRYREEYNKTTSLSNTERTAIITALYVTHIGHSAPLAFLSNALKIDVGSMLDKFDRDQNGLRLLHRRGDYVQTVPSIGATNILEHVISDQNIVDCIVVILRYLAEDRWPDDFERHIFGQMMRYSILQSVVKEPGHDPRCLYHVLIQVHR